MEQKATADMVSLPTFSRRHIVRLALLDVKRGNRPQRQSYVNYFNNARGSNGRCQIVFCL